MSACLLFLREQGCSQLHGLVSLESLSIGMGDGSWVNESMSRHTLSGAGTFGDDGVAPEVLVELDIQGDEVIQPYVCASACELHLKLRTFQAVSAARTQNFMVKSAAESDVWQSFSNRWLLDLPWSG